MPIRTENSSDMKSTSSIEERFKSDVSQNVDEEDMPPLDNRHLNLIHEELEKLNIATDVINKLEVLMDSARATFRVTQGSWTEKLNELKKKYDNHIEKARPYYKLTADVRQLREELQKAAERFERATSLLVVAKQQVSLTQDSLSRQTSVPPECLEVLNHHIQRVSEAEEERTTAEALHAAKAYSLQQITERVRKIKKENSSSIKKSWPYFEKTLEFTLVLEAQKAQIQRLEKEVRQKKSDYTTSLRNLERISDQIHEERSINEDRSSEASDEGKIETMSTSSSSPIPGNPPPYQPTAPPPYEDAYATEKVPEDESIVLSVMQDKKDAKHTRSLGSGVILLAQQLYRSNTERSPVQNAKLTTIESDADISYHTRPAGLAQEPFSDNVSDTSSIFINDDAIPAMLTNHSELIKEIESATDRVGSILRSNRSVSDVNLRP